MQEPAERHATFFGICRLPRVFVLLCNYWGPYSSRVSVPLLIQQKLAQMMSCLIKVPEEFNVAVYITDQVISDTARGVFVTDPKKPAGGHVLAHASTIRLMFRNGKGEQRICKVFDAPNLPEGEAISFLCH